MLHLPLQIKNFPCCWDLVPVATADPVESGDLGWPLGLSKAKKKEKTLVSLAWMTSAMYAWYTQPKLLKIMIFTSKVLKQETASLSHSSFSSLILSSWRWRFVLVSSSCCSLYWASWSASSKVAWEDTCNHCRRRFKSAKSKQSRVFMGLYLSPVYRCMSHRMESELGWAWYRIN